MLRVLPKNQIVEKFDWLDQPDQSIESQSYCCVGWRQKRQKTEMQACFPGPPTDIVLLAVLLLVTRAEEVFRHFLPGQTVGMPQASW